MGTSQADKAASHQRIVRVAAGQIRSAGFDSVNVAATMSEAGLTHGAFYRHFDSREALLAEAVGEALKPRETRPGGYPGGRNYPTPAEYIDDYLGQDHRDHPETGCPVVALANDISHADSDLRSAYTKEVLRFLAFYGGRKSASSEADKDRAFVTMAAMVGAVLVARAVESADLSNEILARTADGLHAIRSEQESAPGGPAVRAAARSDDPHSPAPPSRPGAGQRSDT